MGLQDPWYFPPAAVAGIGCRLLPDGSDPSKARRTAIGCGAAPSTVPVRLSVIAAGAWPLTSHLRSWQRLEQRTDLANSLPSTPTSGDRRGRIATMLGARCPDALDEFRRARASRATAVTYQPEANRFHGQKSGPSVDAGLQLRARVPLAFPGPVLILRVFQKPLSNVAQKPQ